MNVTSTAENSGDFEAVSFHSKQCGKSRMEWQSKTRQHGRSSRGIHPVGHALTDRQRFLHPWLRASLPTPFQGRTGMRWPVCSKGTGLELTRKRHRPHRLTPRSSAHSRYRFDAATTNRRMFGVLTNVRFPMPAALAFPTVGFCNGARLCPAQRGISRSSYARNSAWDKSPASQRLFMLRLVSATQPRSVHASTQRIFCD
jgi:hypothetical protein